MGKSFCWEWSQHQNQRPFSELLPSLAQECEPEAASQQGSGPVWSERSAALRGGLWRLQKALHRQVHKDLSACESASRIPVKMSQAGVLSVHLLVCLPAGVCVHVCVHVCARNDACTYAMGNRCWVSSTIALPYFFFETPSFTEPRAHCLVVIGWPARPQNPSVPVSLRAGVTITHRHACFFWCWRFKFRS